MTSIFRSLVRNPLKMKIVQFKCEEGKVKIGIVNGEKVIDVNSVDNTLPSTLVELLERDDALQSLKSAISKPSREFLLEKVKLLSPIIRPDKVLGAALNYKGDLDKRNVPYPKEPIVFSKFASTIIGPGDDIPKPLSSNALDYEVEIAAVIGRKAQHVKAEKAMEYIFGYTITQDLTAKDWVSRNGGQFVMCKSGDGFTPLGPCLVTKDEVGDPYNLKLKTWLNGELKQDGNSGEMIYRIEQLIEYLSSMMTLLPGDVILTGTPYGVGQSQNPPRYLQPGDVLESEVEKIGRMSHRIV